MSSSKRENIERIPKEGDIGGVQKAVSEQGGVEGQRKEVNVGDYAKTAALGQLLKNLHLKNTLTLSYGKKRWLAATIIVAIH